MPIIGYIGKTEKSFYGPALYAPPFWKADLYGLYKHLKRLADNLAVNRWNENLTKTRFSEEYEIYEFIPLNALLNQLREKYSWFNYFQYREEFNDKELAQLTEEEENSIFHYHHLYVYQWLAHSPEFKYFLNFYFHSLHESFEDFLRCVDAYTLKVKDAFIYCYARGMRKEDYLAEAALEIIPKVHCVM